MAATQITVDLANQAATLSSKLYAVDESVKQSATDVESIANEIAVLSAVLRRLHEAMTFDPDRYTESFQQDLEELVNELKLVFKEIGDVAVELEKQDGNQTGTVKRFFKKGKVQYLQKHLEALKTTLAVMRTVLQHGCEYSPSRSHKELLTSARHTLREEHAILDSVFLNNRNAIIELHDLDEQYQKARTSVDAHHRRKSSILSDIAEFPPVPDAVSPSTVEPKKVSFAQNTSPHNSFSSRGMRLGVHMSILDMGAHAAPDVLKDKWIQTSRAHAHQRTMSGARSALDPPSGQHRRTSPSARSSGGISSDGKTPLQVNHNRANRSPNMGKTHERTEEIEKADGSQHHGWISKTTAEKLHKVIDRLEVSPLPAGQENQATGKGTESGTGNGGSRFSFVLSLHKKRKSSSVTAQEVMDAFPVEVEKG